MSAGAGMNYRTSTTKMFRFLISAFFLLSSPLYAAQRITYYHLDALGSPVAATDEQGNVLWREQYEPYGTKRLNPPSAQDNSRWYTGHPYEQDFGLSYMGGRWYDPKVGRFMGVDPKPFDEENGFSFNRYTYANNNPYRYVDPDGRNPALVEFVATCPEVPLTCAIGLGVTAYYGVKAIRGTSQAIKNQSSEGESSSQAGSEEPTGQASPENPSTIEGEGRQRARTNKLRPDPNAEGPHTQFKTDPQTGKVTGYTEFDKSGNPVKRFRGQGIPHGGMEPPFVLEPKLGKGPGSPPKVPRQPRPDELPKGY